jgi:hypothetical protein
MGYSVGFEGPHPSRLPLADPGIQNKTCGHTGYLDVWHGDEITGPGHVWSCGIRCGQPGSQIFCEELIIR